MLLKLNWAVRGAVVIAALATLSACGGDDAKKAEAEKAAAARTAGQAVTVAVAGMVNQPRTVTASGTVSAWEEVPVGAETGGLVAIGVYVDEGTYVRQGQLLVKLNDDLLQAQLRQQQAAVAAAEANASREDAALARAEELRGRGFLSQASLDTALANQRSARAQLASAQAGLSEIRTRLDQTNIRAPVAGLISSRSVTRGQIVQPGTELFRMVRDGRLELDAQVPETELALIRAGQQAAISSDQVGETTGQVRIVTPEVNADNRLGIARIALARGGGFHPGMFARAVIDVGSLPAVTVPTASVLYRENRSGVFLLGDNNQVRFQPVIVLSRTATMTAVDGLAAGSRVVVDGAGFLGDGDRVRISGTTAAPAVR
ncbi:efflux RND transporter periplasmic adaptor subunit [Rhizobium sp. CRIBSB]|nr:efflux RND transporter periplasmic adaptor subunit [Rhizobium sp. CRIBSB]